MTQIQANNPNKRSWIEVPLTSDFPIQNIPFGIFQTKALSPRVCTRIGDYVIDIFEMTRIGYFDNIEIDYAGAFNSNFLNDFIALGKPAWQEVRNTISTLFDNNNQEIRDFPEQQAKILYRVEDVEMMLPVQIGDYTDFYSSMEHATNVGKMFRDPENALLPNWKHIPVAYHGRSSSIKISGTSFHRPKGQIKPAEGSPKFSASKFLDFELEMAFIVGKNTELGDSISTSEAEDAIFGMVIFNDLSARDIQKWEYVPLGPFLSKNFGSAISPWVVTLDALQPYKVKSPVQDVKVLPYLEYEGDKSYNIQLEVYLQPKNKKEYLICKSNFKNLYWNMSQQLAHHTINGCNMNVGDLCASGTISGSTPNSFGSLLELTWNGQNPLKLGNSIERKSLEDFDTVVMKAYAMNGDARIGFGECRAGILPEKK